MIFLRSRLKTELWIPAEPGRNSRWPVGISVCNSTHWYPHQTWALRRNCTSSWEHAVHLIPGALPWIIPENRQRPNHDPTGRLEKLKGKHFHFCFVCFSWGRFILLALSRALAPSLPVSINLFFPPVSVHSLNINICRTDVAMDASCSSQFCSEGFLRESCTSAADRWKPCLLFVRFFSLSLLIAFYKPFADRMAPFKLFELRGRTLVQSAPSSEALCVFVLPLIGHAYPKGSLTSCHILDLCLKIAVSRCLSTGAVPGQTLHTVATPRD